MNLYIFSENKYKKLNPKPFLFEKNLQKLFEDNLNEITGLEMVRSEFEVRNKRIDTLAFNSDSNAFVIIEYKRDKDYSVTDQGIAYLSLMLEHKAEFILEYNSRFNKNLKIKEIKWNKSLVVFISQDFTEFQLRAANYKYFPIILLEVKYFENGLLMVNELRKSTQAELLKQVIMAEDPPPDQILQDIKIENPPVDSGNWYKTTLWATIRKLGN